LDKLLNASRLHRVLAYLFVAALPFALYMPLLGAQGLWDPWETHYAEVARRILVDGDLITLRWHDEFFFSKPAFLFWTIALSFKIFGVTEWAARFPVVLFSALGLLALFHYTRKLFGTAQGLVAAAVLATIPFWAMISRQAMTDIEFVVPMSAGILALTWYLSGDSPGRIHAWFAYFCFGIAVLAKGILGAALPGAVFLVAIVISGRWDVIRRARLPEGVGIFLVVTLPWYLAVSILQGKAFLYEFFFLHHLARAGGGVHGERGTFEYFISQLGWGTLPWIIIVLPAAMHAVKEIRRLTKAGEGAPLLRRLILVAWAAGSFALFTIARTKFHHYVFPAVVPLAAIIALWAVDLFGRRADGWEKLLVIAGCFFCLLLAREIVADSDRMTFLFTYAYERPAGSPQGTGMAAVAAMLVFSAGLILLSMADLSAVRKLGGVGAFGAALFFTCALLYSHMPAAAMHTSQKESFDRWKIEKKEGDRFYNWKMNWRGEIFYSWDRIKKVSRLEQLRPILAKPGRTFIISTIERYRQLDLEIERIRGKKMVQLNLHDSRYGFGVYDGPVLPAAPPPPLVDSVPEGVVPAAATMGDGLVEIAGYRVDARSARIGDSFMVTLYWKPLKKIQERWIVFIHGEKYDLGEAKRFNGNHVTGEGMYGTEKWEPGTIIEDEFAVCVDYGIPTGLYDLSAGLYRDNDRLGVDESWLHDGHDRIPIGQITVTGSGYEQAAEIP
jgi:4-amino-4-deoxy-L-arabinose transferase-like glycosyltransferase